VVHHRRAGGGPRPHVWPRPGRTFVVAPHHTFEHFATAIDDAFARWDRARLHEFYFRNADDSEERVGLPDPDWDDEPITNIRTEKLRRLRHGEQFIYVFDLGDDWTHLCTVNPAKDDPLDAVGLAGSEMPGPLPVFGWGDIPDQYGRRWPGDSDDEDPVPPDPELADLPPLREEWGRTP
jgi:hypothetical protein